MSRELADITICVFPRSESYLVVDVRSCEPSVFIKSFREILDSIDNEQQKTVLNFIREVGILNLDLDQWPDEAKSTLFIHTCNPVLEYLIQPEVKTGNSVTGVIYFTKDMLTVGKYIFRRLIDDVYRTRLSKQDRENFKKLLEEKIEEELNADPRDKQSKYGLKGNSEYYTVWSRKDVI